MKKIILFLLISLCLSNGFWFYKSYLLSKLNENLYESLHAEYKQNKKGWNKYYECDNIVNELNEIISIARKDLLNCEEQTGLNKIPKWIFFDKKAE
jgi:hypothetical protein